MSATATHVNTGAISTEAVYKVIRNAEEQYSIWPADRDIPFGWEDEGTEGVKSACFDYIQAVWTDFRPKSVREAMDEPATV